MGSRREILVGGFVTFGKSDRSVFVVLSDYAASHLFVCAFLRTLALSKSQYMCCLFQANHIEKEQALCQLFRLLIYLNCFVYIAIVNRFFKNLNAFHQR